MNGLMITFPDVVILQAL